MNTFCVCVALHFSSDKSLDVPRARASTSGLPVSRDNVCLRRNYSQNLKSDTLSSQISLLPVKSCFASYYVVCLELGSVLLGLAARADSELNQPCPRR